LRPDKPDGWDESMAENMASRTVIVVNPQGFHARPAHEFVKLASQFQAEVKIVKDNERINGKSILDLLTLGAGNGTKLSLLATGADAEAAVAALAGLIEHGFGEMDPSQ
jgi:phosphotransferase system HPr (HPr) family protein